MIGFFDSGVGGLTIIESVHKLIPEYDTIYLGDTLRAPYGNKIHDELVKFTIQGVDWLIKKGCNLVIIACNSASASALKEVQQDWLPKNYPDKRILGIIIPTVEKISDLGYKKIGIFSTVATKESGAYEKEFYKLNKNIRTIAYSCPNWAGMIERGLAGTEEMKYEVKKEVKKFESISNDYNAILLACTHYPYIKNDVEAALSKDVPVFNQGEIVAESLRDYLNRHTEIEATLQKNNLYFYYVTANAQTASDIATKRFGFDVSFKQCILD